MLTGDIMHRGYKIGSVMCKFFAVAPDGRFIDPEPWDGKHGEEAALDRMKRAIDKDIENCDHYPHTWAATEEKAKAIAADLMNERGKVYEVEAYDDFAARVKADTLASVPLQEITAEFYDQMLCVLPPMYREGAIGFFMCEYTDGTITNQFASRRTSDFSEPRYYVKAVDMLDRSTWITPAMIDALPDGPRLEWFGKVEGPES